MPPHAEAAGEVESSGSEQAQVWTREEARPLFTDGLHTVAEGVRR